MIIEEGKFYRTAGGEKVGPMEESNERSYAFTAFLHGDNRLFQSDGKHGTPNVGNRPQYNLVAEWSHGPVRTVTRKEVVTGIYGRISVSQQGIDEPRLLIALADLGGNVNMVHQGWSLDELSEAISNLTAIRDALQEQDK